ncbi:efflux RND transporter periplasmic adaptor subunit [Falsiroseomonas oryzae]|uniref:efflux RND transporter periplasmic adaptor subunit n=1 Tax=Falsiroseomonas oryzae TaxID=2766473 RepID=UPI0022EA4DE9|nr:efflux RND transporter periplasmic adaptor subunit [Roseomonas sp. MO-31]
MQKLRVLLAALPLLAAALPAAAQFGPQGPPAVGVITAERRPVTESTEFVGRVEAVDRVDLRARVTGFLQERLFREGQEVAANAQLFRLEEAPFEADVARAAAQVAAAEAELSNANIQLARARELVRTQAGTQARVDDATAAQRSAQATLLGAQAQLRVSQINLGYTVISAPFAGKIGRSNFSPGAVVGPDSGPLATLVSQDPMRVSFPVSLRLGIELRDRFEGRGGASAVLVRIRLANGELFNQSGRIDFIDTQVNRDTDTLLVRAVMPNPLRSVAGPTGEPERQLIDGMFVNVFVEGAEPVASVVIPRAAVLQDQQGNFVFVLGQGNRAERRGVTLGRSIADQVVVERGLEGGETVVTEGVQRVRPGQPVQPNPAAPPAVRTAPDGQAPRG